MSTAALVIITKKGNNLDVHWVVYNKDIHMEYYLAIKKEIIEFESKMMELEILILSKVTQIKKDNSMFFLRS